MDITWREGGRVMNLFRVESENVAYDEDISMVILASSEARALEIAKENWRFRPSRKHESFQVVKVDIEREGIVEVTHYGE